MLEPGVDKNRVLVAALEPGEAGKSYPGSAGHGPSTFPGCSMPQCPTWP